jgi:single-strand DNA-binding protein
MAKDLNKAMLIGRLGADPEMRFTAGGKAVTSFRVATGSSWTDKATGEKNESTEWHSIVVWDKLAEICNQYLVKGSKVYIEGRLQTRKWEDRDGNDRYTTEIVLQDMIMLDSKPRDSDDDAPQPRQSTTPRKNTPMPIEDDDIPF